MHRICRVSYYIYSINIAILLEVILILFFRKPNVFHILDDFQKPGKMTTSSDRMMATLSMNMDKQFETDSELTKKERAVFFEKLLQILQPWISHQKRRHPEHNVSIAILKSTANQSSEQKIHVDFDPKKKSNSFSTIIPLNDYCVINMKSSGCEKMSLHVNKGFMLEFKGNQPHGGGTNNCGKDQFRVHAYFYTGNSLPKNKVFYVL